MSSDAHTFGGVPWARLQAHLCIADLNNRTATHKLPLLRVRPSARLRPDLTASLTHAVHETVA